MERLRQLDGLRIVMALVIVVSHFELSAYSYGVFFNKYFSDATIAVNFFFIISGFGVAYKEQNSEESRVTIRESVNFAVNKIKKIYPIYIFSLFIMMPYLFFSRYAVLGIIKNLFVLMCEFVFCVPLLQIFTFSTEFNRRINPVCWFLSCLFVCYFLCPLFLRFLKKYNKKTIHSVIM